MNRPHISRPRTALAAVAATLLALPLSGCGAKADGTGGGVATDIGVTGDTITLGALTDMSGPFATLGTSVTRAQQLWVRQTNARGGICHRRIVLKVRDHGYDAARAVAGYGELTPQVLAYPQFIGSPFVAAVRPRIDRQDRLLVTPQAWSGSLLGSAYIKITGTTYDIQTINAIAYLTAQHRISKGDAVGHIYFEGDYGENALAGSRYAAKRLGLTLVEQRVTPADQDMTAQVTALARAGVRAIVLSVGSRQAASTASVAAAQNLRVPIVGGNPTFTPQLLKTGAAPALLASFHLISADPPIGGTQREVARLAAEYTAAYQGSVLDQGVVSGYQTISLVGRAIEAACRAGRLTREGVARTMASLKLSDDGFGVTQDFTDPARPATLATFVLRPDATVPGGLVVERQAEPSGLAESFIRDK